MLCSCSLLLILKADSSTSLNSRASLLAVGQNINLIDTSPFGVSVLHREKMTSDQRQAAETMHATQVSLLFRSVDVLTSIYYCIYQTVDIAAARIQGSDEEVFELGKVGSKPTL